MAEGNVVESEDLLTPGISGPAPALPATTLAELERQAVRAALARVGGNRKRAAEALGIGERTLYDKIKRYNLS
jgi:two-component system response regulator FlrC